MLCCAVLRWQVVDARDPLTYLSQDLVEYARELHPTKRSFVLLNKADLLPAAVREAWADYLDSRGIQYGFWSAFAASEAQARARHDASAQGLASYTTEAVNAHFWDLLGVSKQQQQQAANGSSSSSRTRILPVEELLEVLEVMARAAVDAAEDDDTCRCVCQHVGCRQPNKHTLLRQVAWLTGRTALGCSTVQPGKPSSQPQKCVFAWPAACYCVGPLVLAGIGCCARSLRLPVLTV